MRILGSDSKSAGRGVVENKFRISERGSWVSRIWFRGKISNASITPLLRPQFLIICSQFSKLEKYRFQKRWFHIDNISSFYLPFSIDNARIYISLTVF